MHFSILLASVLKGYARIPDKNEETRGSCAPVNDDSTVVAGLVWQANSSWWLSYLVAVR